jgi:pilus assembly protein CpaE
VSDYLVRPLKTETLGHDIAATLIDKLGASDSRLIALIGAKGGVGTTSLAEALAWGLSDRFGQKTFLLDAAGGWSSLSVGMDFEPVTTTAEAVRAAVERNQDSLSRMMFQASEKLTVLSTGGDVMLEDIVDPAGFEGLLDFLMVTYPVVIVDLSAAPAGLKRTTLARAHEILLVTIPTLPSVRASRTLMQEIKDVRGGSGESVDIIVNMIGMAPKVEVAKAQIEEGLDCKVSAVIPFDPGLFISVESEARKMTEDKTGRTIADSILPIARKVLADAGGDTAGTEIAEDKKGGLTQFLTKLKAKS